MSKFTDTLGTVAGVASNVGVIGGVAKGVAGLLGIGGDQQKKQYEYQKKLMSYQNALNRSNSLVDYQRQRELTADNALLQKIGLRQAGMNTAMGDGSTASAASVGGTAATSTPSALPTNAQIDSQYSSMATQAASVIGNLSLQRSQNQLVQEQAENLRLHNLTQLQRDVAELSEKRASAKDAETRAMYSRMMFEANERYISQNAKNDAILKDNQAFMSDLDAHYYGQFKVEELEDLKESILQKKASRQLTEKDVKYYDYRLRQINAYIENLKSSSALNRSQSANVDTQTQFNKDTMLDREQQERLKNVPKDTKELLMRNKYIRDYLDCVENGKPVPYSVEWHCDKLLLEYGLRSSEYKGISVGAIINAILR